MLKIHKILFPVDFSERSAGAAQYVAALVGRLQSHLTLLHVVETAYPYGSFEISVSQLEEFRAQRLEGARTRLAAYLTEEFKHFDVNRVLLEGDAARQITDYAKDNGIALIMIPSHGYGPFRRFVLGSVTAKVLHDAHCPVWTGAHTENAPPLEQIHCRNIVAAIDLGPRSRDVLAWANCFAKEYDAHITVVHAVPAMEARPAKYFDTDLHATLVADAKERLGQLLLETGVIADVHVDDGDPATVIREGAELVNGDLVVIARGAITGGLGRLRTHSYAIIRSCPCPVLSV